ncbi:putative phage repressor [Acetobacter aceti NRIC 0242]|uniref:Repressor n=1 Tax=Acetobacter aceti NBRC 14818 TaxID=887700 RepID=A0AB33ID03_ACEAC|nr:XRE family transcriptional regulator [Acetobacter aceti]TCS32451.1 phage repressor protein C with HTH and peptisase S24 domain [Acetobacter aceti NBRC 14818]BCK74975.1 repressor [Acetobacter aceti NBRC 14818]GAN56931.1 transcriptional regulator phage repressor [Acetobacter aceti NBRC 14818]GBO81392.1 putative phage repressor [Acetobacter aceti NRIC 0242]
MLLVSNVSVSEDNWDVISIPERLREAVDKGGGYNAIVRRSGVSQSSLNEYLKGRVLRIDTASRLADACGVSLQWLLFGDGPSGRQPIPAQSGCDQVSIPLFEGEVSAGPGALAPNVENFAAIEIGRTSLPSQVLSRLSHLVAVTVRGDSMYPTLSDGDVVFVDTGDHAVITGSVYVMRRDTDLLIKRLSWNMSGDLVVSSDNSQYKDEQISADRARQLFEQGASPIVVVGRVVWRMGTIGAR